MATKILRKRLGIAANSHRQDAVRQSALAAELPPHINALVRAIPDT